MILTDDQGEYPLGLHLEILADPTTGLTIEDVSSAPYAAQFTPSREEMPNYGVTRSAYWARFRVVNEAGEARSWR